VNQAHFSYLFPDPLYSVNLDGEVEPNLIRILEPCLDKDNLRPNDHNSITKNDRLLDTVLADSRLRAVIVDQIHVYKHNILGLGDNVELRITQSWMNYNRAGERHHRHNHPNSIISGVFYVQMEENTSEFMVHRHMNSAVPVLDPLPEYQTEWNAPSMKFNPRPYDLYLFPSQMLHSVTQNRSSVPRISISFNTFYNGEFYAGTNKLAKLRINVE